MKLYDNDAYREEFVELVYDLLRDDGTNDRANQIIDAFDSAPEVEAEPLRRNAPLTLEELREMDGEPVWVVPLAGQEYEPPESEYHMKEQWIIIHAWHWRHYNAELGDYGKTWLAYRRKPEEGTT